MPLRDDLLTPIPGDSAGGVSLRYDPIFDKVKEARREDEDIPTGELPDTPRKLADHPLVIRLAGEALATKSKDLQLAAWLTESLLRRDGINGLTEGLVLLREMLLQFWDSLHPEIEEEDDIELRAAPLEWVGGRLVLAIRGVPLTKAGYSHLDFEISRDVGYEAAAAESEEKARRRQEKVAEGKLTAEEWDRAVESTDLAYYQALESQIEEALTALATLDTVSEEKFGALAPSYRPLREALEQLQLVATGVVRKRLPPAPDASADGDQAEAAGADGVSSNGASAAGMRRRSRGGPSLMELASAEVRAGRPARAVDMLMSAAHRGRSRRARFIRRTGVARIMVEAGLFPLAIPLLEQLASEIDEFKLEDWESGDIVATPLVLLWRCYDRTGMSEGQKEPLYLRVCRLDPVQAMGITPGAG